VVVFGGAHLAVHVLAPRALGAGDVKLAGSLGAVLGAVGWSALVVGAVLAALGTAVVALARRTRAAPHGPGLLLATWLLAAWVRA
jgi:leader peptidase (prepilin peptidase)/N-methyltransferase